MRRAFRISSLLCVCLLAACSGRSPFGDHGDNAATQPAPSATPDAAAQAGLHTLQELVSEKNYKGLGFTSLEERKRAALDAPMRTYVIGLDALKRANAEADPGTLLQDAGKTLYPIKVDNAVVSSLSVTQRADGWRASEFGNAAIARTLTGFRKNPDDAVVEVPALLLRFVARKSDSDWVLIPIRDDARFEWHAGDEVNARRVVQVLQRYLDGYQEKGPI